MTIEALLGTYVIIQLWANTMGLTVLFVLDNVINRYLIERGYTNIPTTGADKIRKFGKGFFKFFIPFYYCVKGIDLVSDRSSFQSIVNEKIRNGEVIPIIKKKKELTPNLMDFPKIEKLPETPKYKAYTNGKSLYEYKKENIEEFSGNLERPDEKNIIAFSKKVKTNSSTKEEELYEYISSLNPKEVKELRKTIEAYSDAMNNSIENTYKYTYDKENAA